MILLLGIVLICTGLVCILTAANAAAKPTPVFVGEQWLSEDPFMQQNPITIVEVAGGWVKYRQKGDKEDMFRSATLAQINVWFPNRYVVTP